MKHLAALILLPLMANPSHAQSVIYQPSSGDVGLYENVRISDEGRGEVFIAKLRMPPGVSPETVFGTPFSWACEGDVLSTSASGLLMRADPDGFSGPDAALESLFFMSADLDVASNETCWGVQQAEASGGSLEDDRGNELRVASAVLIREGEAVSSSFEEIRVLRGSAEMISAASLSFGFTPDASQAEINLRDLLWTPRDVLGEEVIQKTGFPNPDEVASLDLDAAYDQGSGDLKVQVRASGLADLDLMVSAPGTDLETLSGALKKAEIRFEDHGLLTIFETLAGASLPDLIREGDVPGTPNLVKDAKFDALRGAVADWIGKGQGHVIVEPSAPVPFLAMGASLMMFPQGFSQFIGLKTVP